jgi:hypothetical protein
MSSSAAPSASAASSLVVEVGPGASGEAVAAAITAALGGGQQGQGLSEEGKARLIEEVTRAVHEERQLEQELEQEKEGRGEGGGSGGSGGSTSTGGTAVPSPPATEATTAEAAADGAGAEPPPFKLPGELPPGREQEEADEVMRLLFEHLKTEEGRCVRGRVDGGVCVCVCVCVWV